MKRSATDMTDHEEVSDEVFDEVRCPICLSAMTAEEELAQILPCGHQFHFDCVIQVHLTLTHPSEGVTIGVPLCPSCRGPRERLQKLAEGTHPRKEWPKFLGKDGTKVVCNLIGLEKQPAWNGREVLIETFAFSDNGEIEKYVVSPLEWDPRGAGGATTSSKKMMLRVNECNLQFVRTI